MFTALTRRHFLALSAATAASALIPATPSKAWVQVVLVAASAVASHLANQGNPTNSLINANYQSLVGLHANVAALNEAMQGVIGQLSDLRNLLLALDENVIEEGLQAALFGAWQTAIERIQGAKRNAEQNMPVDERAVFHQVLDAHNNYQQARNTLMEFSARNDFSGALNVCAAWPQEFDCLSYLVEKDLIVKSGAVGLGNLEVLVERYLDYFRAAVDPANPGSLIALRDAAYVHAMGGRVTAHPPLIAGQQIIGCSIVDKEKLGFGRINGAKEISRKIQFQTLVVEVKRDVVKNIIPIYAIDTEVKFGPIVTHNVRASLGGKGHSSIFDLQGGPKLCRNQIDFAPFADIDQERAQELIRDFNDGQKMDDFRSAEANFLGIDLIVALIERSITSLLCLKEVYAGNAGCRYDVKDTLK